MKLDFSVAQIVQVKNRGAVTLQHFANADDKQPAAVVTISFTDPLQVKDFTIGEIVTIETTQQ